MEFFSALLVLGFWMFSLFPIALANSTTGPGPDERPTSAAVGDEYDMWQQGYRYEARRFRPEPFIEHYGGGFPWMMGIAWVVLVAMAATQIYFFRKMQGDLRLEPATTADGGPSAKITRQVLRSKTKRPVVFRFEYPNTLAAEQIKLMGQFNIILPEFRALQDGVSRLRDDVTALQTRFATALTELDTLKLSFRDQDLEDTVMKLRDQIVRIDEWRKLQETSTPANQVDEDTIKRIVGYMNLSSKTGVDEDVSRVKLELDQIKQSIVTRERFTETDEQVSQLKSTIHSEPWKIVQKELQSELEAVRKELEATKQKTVDQELQSELEAVRQEIEVAKQYIVRQELQPKLEAVRQELEDAKQQFVTNEMRDFLTEAVQGNALVNGKKDLEALRVEQLKMKKASMSAIEDVKSKYDTLGTNHDDLVAKVTKLEETFSLGPSHDEYRKEYEDLNVSVRTSLKELITSLTTVKDMEKRLAVFYGRVIKCEKQQEEWFSKVTELEERFSVRSSHDEVKKEVEDLNNFVHSSLKELNSSLATVKDMEKRLTTSDDRVKKCEKQQEAFSSKLEAGEGAANEKGLMEELQSKMADFKTREGEIDTRISLVEKEIEELRRGDITEDVHHKLEKLETDHDQLIRELEDFGAVKRKKSAPSETRKERKKTVVDKLDKRIEEAWDTAENALIDLDFLKKGRLWEFEKRLNTLFVEVLHELPYKIECCVKKENPNTKPPRPQYLDVLQKELDSNNPTNTTRLHGDGTFKEGLGPSLTKTGKNATGETPEKGTFKNGLGASRWADDGNVAAKTAKSGTPKQEGGASAHTPSKSTPLKPGQKEDSANPNTPKPGLKEEKKDGANADDPSTPNSKGKGKARAGRGSRFT